VRALTDLSVSQDTKNKYIPHKALTYYFITSAWSIYCAFTQLFVIFIAFGQLDLLLVRLASDLAANGVTLSMYLHGKIHDPEMHARNQRPNAEEEEGGLELHTRNEAAQQPADKEDEQKALLVQQAP
jgi:hypothetical protein